jgi:threonylcarbamoyladenosine tRNA methylthiotransferase MtaB
MSGRIVSLGCRLNIAESEAIGALLADAPPTVVVNSCAVTAEAVRQSRRAVRRLRREHPDARLVVTHRVRSNDRASGVCRDGRSRCRRTQS